MASRFFKTSDLKPGRAPGPPIVTFAWRTSSGRYVNLSRDSLDSDISDLEFFNYTVQIPATPDNQPMDPSTRVDPPMSQRVEELFTGGYNSATRAHLMDKVIESKTIHPQMAGAKGFSCVVLGCDGKVTSDGRGEDIIPCECDFKICRDCFIDAVRTSDGIFQGCKELFENTDLAINLVELGWPLPLPSNVGMSKMERRLSLMKYENRSALIRSQTGVDFDHNRWLFETEGTYGYGNAIWPKDGGGLAEDKKDENGEPLELLNKPRRPLTRKLKIPAAILSPYR